MERARLRAARGPSHYLGLKTYGELEGLLSALRTENIAIDELTLAGTDLEQVFLRIMAGSATTDEAHAPAAVPEA